MGDQHTTEHTIETFMAQAAADLREAGVTDMDVLTIKVSAVPAGVSLSRVSINAGVGL